jgi:hypothetical protein
MRMENESKGGVKLRRGNLQFYSERQAFCIDPVNAINNLSPLSKCGKLRLIIAGKIGISERSKYPKILLGMLIKK